jgi:hypothetical protein
MKKLNQQATRIFCQLLDKMGIETYIRLTSDDFMPLVMEQIGELIQTPYGIGQCYSLSHSYEQNGDLMRDPEMVFIVVDNRKETKDYHLIGIYPQMYQQDNLGLYEESACIENNAIITYKPFLQKEHGSFASQWLQNIKQQGFLK